jgi:hypothetical protein
LPEAQVQKKHCYCFVLFVISTVFLCQCQFHFTLRSILHHLLPHARADLYSLQNLLVLQVVYVYFCTKGSIRNLQYGALNVLFQVFICIVRHVDAVSNLERSVASLE